MAPVIKESFWQLYEKRQNSDIIFETKDEGGKARQFHAHKLILGYVSDVFQTMFYGSLPETQEKIVIEDVTADAFQHIIQYAYQKKEAFKNAEVAWRVVYASHKYAIEALQKAALEYILGNLTPELAFVILGSGFDLCPSLNEKAAKMFSGKLDSILESKKCCSLSAPNFNNLVKSVHLELEPRDLFELVQTWAESSCHGEGLTINGDNLRAKMDPFLPSIRFLMLTPEEFISQVLPLEILSRHEVGAISKNLLAIDEQLKCPLPSWCNPKCASRVPNTYCVKRNVLLPSKLRHSLCRGMHSDMESLSSIFHTSQKAFLVSFSLFVSLNSQYLHEYLQYKLNVEIKYVGMGGCPRMAKDVFVNKKPGNHQDHQTWEILLQEPFALEPNQAYALTITSEKRGLQNTLNYFSVDPADHQSFFKEKEYKFQTATSKSKTFTVTFDKDMSGLFPNYSSYKALWAIKTYTFSSRD